MLLLNGAIIVIARDGSVIHSPSPSRFPADLRLSHHDVPTRPPLDGHHRQQMAQSWAIKLINTKHLKHLLFCSLGVAIREEMRLRLSLAH